MTAPSEKNEVVKPLWLFLLREGGRWAANVMKQELALGEMQARTTLFQMAKRGTVIKHKPDERSKVPTYEVTPDCKVPVSVTLAEIDGSRATL